MSLFSRVFQRRRIPPPIEDSLGVFGSEQVGPGSGSGSGIQRAASTSAAWAAGAVLVAVLAAGVYLFLPRAGSIDAASLASVTIESDPEGADVMVGGVLRGATPLTLSLAPGEHPVEVVSEGRRKPVRVNARAGASIVHHVEFAQPVPDTRPPAPPEARPRPAPTAGTVEPARPRSTAGWLAVSSQIPLTLIERGEVIGTTAASRIMLPAGRHSLRLVNEALGFAEPREVRIEEGKVSSIQVALPRAPLAINAVPWAEVWIDGRKVGDTPIGKHMVAIGEREVVFRHPELGERRQKVTVSLSSPARISVDLRKR